jgi:hypothetical protein
MADEIRATPRSPILGLFSDLVNLPLQYMSSPERTQQSQGAAQFLYGTGIPKTLERMSYGDSLFSGAGGLGGTTRMRPETAEALMNVAPVLPVAGRVAGRTGQAFGRMAGEEINAAMTGQPTRSVLGAITPKPKQIFIGENAKTWNKAAADKAVELEKAGVSPEEIWSATGTFRGVEGKLRQEINDNLSTPKGMGNFEDIIMKAYDRGVERTRGTGQREYWQPYKTTVEDVFLHNELAKAYPDLMGIETQMMPKGMNYKGTFAQSGDTSTVHINENLPSNETGSVMLHELQHAVQEKEGFARGGSSDSLISDIAKAKYDLKEVEQKMLNLQDKASDEARFYISKSQQDPEFKKYVDEAFNKYKAQFGEKSKDNPYGVDLQDAVKFDLLEKSQLLNNFGLEADKLRRLGNLEPKEAYRNLAGEAEARAVQSRMNMTPQERLETFPYQSYDVPVDQLIYRDPFRNTIR